MGLNKTHTSHTFAARGKRDDYCRSVGTEYRNGNWPHFQVRWGCPKTSGTREFALDVDHRFARHLQGLEGDLEATGNANGSLIEIGMGKHEQARAWLGLASATAGPALGGTFGRISGNACAKIVIFLVFFDIIPARAGYLFPPETREDEWRHALTGKALSLMFLLPQFHEHGTNGMGKCCRRNRGPRRQR